MASSQSDTHRNAISGESWLTLGPPQTTEHASNRQPIIICIKRLRRKLAQIGRQRAICFNDKNASVLPDAIQVLKRARRISLIAVQVVDTKASCVRRAKSKHFCRSGYHGD